MPINTNLNSILTNFANSLSNRTQSSAYQSILTLLKPTLLPLMITLSLLGTHDLVHAHEPKQTGAAAMTQPKQVELDPKLLNGPFPFTKEELTKQLLEVLDQPEGYITKEQVETIFGLTLPELQLKPSDEKMQTWGIYRGKDGYFSMSVNQRSNQQTAFSFNWIRFNVNEVIPWPPTEMCVNYLDMGKALEQRGWVMKGKAYLFIELGNLGPFTLTYIKGKKGQLWISADEQSECVRGIDLFSSNHRPVN
jgi:hypothetical protein